MSRRLGDADTLLLAGLMTVAIALRLYCFVMTQGQPLWWDEAEYMLKAKSFVYDTPDTGWYTSRPIAFPLLAAAVMKIGGGEETIRLLWLGLSVLSLFLLCRIGEMLFNKRVGLYAGAVYAVFYVDLFFSARLLVDMPQVFFVLVAAYLLVKDQFGGGARYGVWAIVPVLALGVATRFTVAIFFAVLALFLIAVRGRRIFRATEWYVSAALGLLVLAPFLAYYGLQYGHPLYRFLTHVGFKHAGPPSAVAMAYVRHFPYYMGLPVLAFFLCGLVQAVATAGLRLRRLGDDPKAQCFLLLLP